MNILSGLEKSGIYPLNPSEVSDRMLAPSMAFNPPSDGASSTPSLSVDQIESPAATSPPLLKPNGIESEKSEFNIGYVRCIR